MDKLSASDLELNTPARGHRGKQLKPKRQTGYSAITTCHSCGRMTIALTNSRHSWQAERDQESCTCHIHDPPEHPWERFTCLRQAGLSADRQKSCISYYDAKKRISDQTNRFPACRAGLSADRQASQPLRACLPCEGICCAVRCFHLTALKYNPINVKALNGNYTMVDGDHDIGLQWANEPGRAKF